VAKKKLLGYREWQQIEQQRKAQRKQRSALIKEQRRAAWWATPATSNYVTLTAYWLSPDDQHRSGYGRSHEPIPPDGACIEGSILPDKRRWPHADEVAIRLTVSGAMDRRVVAERLTRLAQRIMDSEEVWRVASGTPLTAPVDIIGTPPRIVERSWWRQSPIATPQTTAPTIATDSPASRPGRCIDLLRGLRAVIEASPRRQRTVEESCEMLVILAIGQEISLLVDRDPWRWEHTPEELRQAESLFAEALQALRSLTSVMSEVMGAEAAAETLLSVFVEGRSVAQ
jgi:hypothetical protein